MSKALILVESDPVVAIDLSQTLNESFPRLPIEVFNSYREAHAALQARGSAPSLLVMSLRESQRAESDLAIEIGRAAQHLVVISDDAQAIVAAVPGCVVVSRPFTGKMIADALIRSGAVAR